MVWSGSYDAHEYHEVSVYGVPALRLDYCVVNKQLKQHCFSVDLRFGRLSFLSGT